MAEVYLGGELSSDAPNNSGAKRKGPPLHRHRDPLQTDGSLGRGAKWNDFRKLGGDSDEPQFSFL
jgi:hypothetical protein